MTIAVVSRTGPLKGYGSATQEVEMVGPISDAERLSFNRRVELGVTLLVGLSAGLITLQIETTAVQTAGSVAFGLVLGFLLARYVVPSGPAPATKQRQRRVKENPFADGGDDSEDSEDSFARAESSDRGDRER